MQLLFLVAFDFEMSVVLEVPRVPFRKSTTGTTGLWAALLWNPANSRTEIEFRFDRQQRNRYGGSVESKVEQLGSNDVPRPQLAGQGGGLGPLLSAHLLRE
jgi:hypothetical protein